MEREYSSSEEAIVTKPQEAFSWLQYASDDGSGSFSSYSSGSFNSSSGNVTRKRDTEIAFSQPFSLSSKKRVSDSTPSKKRYKEDNIPVISELNLPSIQEESKVDLNQLFGNSISRLRRGSLELTVKYAVSSALGRRQTNEDKYQAISFSESQKEDQDINNNNNESIITHNHDTTDDNNNNNNTTTHDHVNHPVQSSEDSMKPITQIEEKGNYAFFAVYDGHGGTQAADFVSKHLHSQIVQHPKFTTDTEEAIREGFRKTEEAFEASSAKNGAVGTTACVGIIVNRTLYVANVGDSAAILCRRGEPVQLTAPHTPKNPEEKARVESCGGVVTKDLRLGHPKWNPQFISLGVTRAIGDYFFKLPEWTEGQPSGLIAEPEIVKIPLTTDDCFLLLASDGFWDVVSTQVAINYILQEHSKDLDSICNKLIDLALTKATEDNTTVLLVKLKDLEAAQPLSKEEETLPQSSNNEDLPSPPPPEGTSS